MDNFQLKPYLGTWYDVAHYPTLIWQKGCFSSVAEYSMINSTTLKVKNTCLDEDGKVIYSRSGEARVVDSRKKSNLRILFNDGMPADPEGWYVVEWTDYDNYSIVSSSQNKDFLEDERDLSENKYLWILSRKPKISSADAKMLLEKTKQLGFCPRKLVTKQRNVY